MAKSHLGVVRSASAEGSEELSLLREGKMSLDEYLETRVTHAIATLPVRLSAEKEAEIRDLLREQLMTDPLLQTYVEIASGIPLDATRTDHE
jgi:hypothetical protein